MIDKTNKSFEAAPGMTHEEKRKLVGQAYDIAYDFAARVYRKFP